MTATPPSRAGAQWDARFAGDDYVYGTRPNDFLAAHARLLPPGARVLSLGEGEGRNAVHLAALGHAVTAVDASAVGLAKANRLAADRGVTIETRVTDLAEYPIAPGAWDAAVLVFCHLPPALRRQVHRAVVAGLRPGGLVLLEAYTPAQLAFRTGGPSAPELLYPGGVTCARTSPGSRSTASTSSSARSRREACTPAAPRWSSWSAASPPEPRGRATYLPPATSSTRRPRRRPAGPSPRVAGVTGGPAP